MKELKIGMKYICEAEVTDDVTACKVHSGGLPVYATPSMIGLMERTAFTCAEECMEEGCSTVGISVDIKHLSATPVGAHVRAECELLEIDGRRLVFSVKAYDDAGIIGEGTHERFIINIESFLAKTQSKI